MDTAIKTCKLMLRNRGYQEIENLLFENVEKNKIIVFIIEDKLSIEHIKNYTNSLIKEAINHCIIIYNEDITPVAKQVIETITEYKFEIFSISELQYNIVEHRLVPKHVKLNSDEAKLIKRKFGSKLPVILKSDPISKYYNFSRGDIIKIIRKRNNEEYITYRIVK
jgi:DNA-directed RNA polymerase I, II, and III subunit RPABC1